ncbi:MAG: dihydropteroate synthase [Methylomonas sp.]|nr:dihydropteroate synthase [Methylomonas sp.]PPD22937.1 MAG: dihydropteroate synthase [Methylomonas sp.]PPD26458.1 MAG: dihydropteroate synthase [Methylomonas sp.]PPD38226.1 MAG: dihydropteroate synthase [Methylomonas sp.]PPD41943.1 MAG: dihydropteroate synthase [Methylomonas sp.]
MSDERILFLTGKLAEKQLRQILAAMAPEFYYKVREMGVKVAALMTTDMIARRLTDTDGATRIVIPGRCRGDIEALSQHLGVPVERGPEEVKDLPQYFGKDAHRYDLSDYRVKIFAEIVDAPNISVDAIIERAQYYRKNGADVIDIGCLPGTAFPHLADSIRTLKQEGFSVSIDSLTDDDLLTGGRAGADYLLSLTEKSLWIADEVAATPILIPTVHGDLTTLDAAIDRLQRKNRAFIVDPILDPIHFGFTESIVRNYQLRQRHPEIDMMLGVGNLTELTHADTSGINALLLGICSELNINHILATEVSQHACRAIREADRARRIMYAAKQADSLPKHIAADLLTMHDIAPFPYTLDEIAALAAEIKDPSYRIQVSRDGLHVFNRDGFHTARDPFDLFPKLGVESDGGHAFYLGVELARAQIAWQLGKRFTQDQALTWGCAADSAEAEADLHTFKPAGTTLAKRHDENR